MPVPKPRPTLRLERQRWAQGYETVVGLDEVGRGAWAGPLTVGVVVPSAGRAPVGILDSKMLSHKARVELDGAIRKWARACAIGHASPQECDRLGMSAAQRLAAERALLGLPFSWDWALLDGRWNFLDPKKSETIIKGDQTCTSIAAASIIAKVARDALMVAADESFPMYRFWGNKGYPCEKHQMGLRGYGPSSIHRRSWVFMEKLPWPGLRSGVGESTQLRLNLG